MKSVILFLLLLPLMTEAQKFIWVDKNAANPIITSDSITANYMFDGYLPVAAENVDSFMAYVYYIGHLLRDRKYELKDSVKLTTGSTTFVIKPITGFYKPRYHITIQTAINGLQMAILLVDSAVPDAMNLRLHNRFFRYLEASTYFRMPYKQIVPVFAPLANTN